MCVTYLIIGRLTEQFFQALARLKYKPTVAKGIRFEEKVIVVVS
jgi:hypothetical protein